MWETLNEVNVSEHIEKRPARGRDLSYLSWAWAWSELKKHYPHAVAKVYENPEGWPYWTDGKTAWVKVSVEIEGLENIDYYPVMDNSHNSIPAEKITSWHINCAIQRGQTKCIARHGLGMYIYAGEDLPEVEAIEQKKSIDEQNQRALEAIAEFNAVKDSDEYLVVREKYIDLLVGQAAVKSVIRAAQLKYKEVYKESTNN